MSLINSKLSTVLTNWHELPLNEKPRLIKTFSNGLNHQTHLISSGENKHVLKLFSQPLPSAISAQKFAANYQLSPKVLYVNLEHDIALMEFIDNYNVKQPLTKNDLSLLGSTLNNLHSLSIISDNNVFNKFDLLKYYNTYLAVINAKDSFARSTHKELLPIIKFFINDQTNWCVCHNDLVKENCFITFNNAKFIDWEYAQINNPWFDLATIIYSLKLDAQQTLQFIYSYNHEWLDRIKTPVFFSALISMLWCDVLWYLARGESITSHNIQTKLSDLYNYKDQFNKLTSK